MSKNLRKIINLKLGNVPPDKHAEVKDEVGDFLVNQVLRDIERGFSPVAGEGKFKNLTEEYAKEEKGGRRTSNLQLEGDLKEAIQFEHTSKGIEYGNFGASQAAKADGHNQHSAKAQKWAASMENPFPKRRYIPKGSQKFTPKIEKEIEAIVKSFEEEPTRLRDIDTRLTSTPKQEEVTKVKTEVVNIFDDDLIEAAIRREINGG